MTRIIDGKGHRYGWREALIYPSEFNLEPKRELVRPIKMWSSSAWVSRQLLMWDGSAWVDKKVKQWTGATWV